MVYLGRGGERGQWVPEENQDLQELERKERKVIPLPILLLLYYKHLYTFFTAS